MCMYVHVLCACAKFVTIYVQAYLLILIHGNLQSNLGDFIARQNRDAARHKKDGEYNERAVAGEED